MRKLPCLSGPLSWRKLRGGTRKQWTGFQPLGSLPFLEETGTLRPKLCMVRDAQKDGLLSPSAPETHIQSYEWVNTEGRIVGVDSKCRPHKPRCFASGYWIGTAETSRVHTRCRHPGRRLGASVSRAGRKVSWEDLRGRSFHVEPAPYHIPAIRHLLWNLNPITYLRFGTYSSHGTVPGPPWCTEFGLVVKDSQELSNAL